MQKKKSIFKTVGNCSNWEPNCTLISHFLHDDELDRKIETFPIPRNETPQRKGCNHEKFVRNMLENISPLPPFTQVEIPPQDSCILLPKAGRQNILQHIAAALNIYLLNEDDCSFLLASIVKPNYPSNMHSALFCLPVSLFCCGRRSSFILNFKVHLSPCASLFSSPVSSLSKLRFSRFSPKPLLQKNGKVRLNSSTFFLIFF